MKLVLVAMSVLLGCSALSLAQTAHDSHDLRMHNNAQLPTLDSLYTDDFGFRGIADVAASDCGDVYVLRTDGEGAGEVLRFHNDVLVGGWNLAWPGVPNNPMAITTDAEGNVYVSLEGGCMDDACIYALVYSPNGDLILGVDEPPDPGRIHLYLADIAVATDGSIWLLDYYGNTIANRIIVLNPDGSVAQVLPYAHARSIVADRKGFIYVSTPSAITRIGGVPQVYPPLNDFTVAGDLVCGYEGNVLRCYRAIDGTEISSEADPFSMISLTAWFPWIRLAADGESEIYAVGHNPEGEEPAIDWLLKYTRPSAVVGFPTSPMQSCTIADTGCQTNYVIERRHDLPAVEGVTLFFDLPAWRLCDGEQPVSLCLFPRSGTGPVFPVNVSTHTAYFRMDNLTSVGFYDLAVNCGGYLDTIQVNVDYRGYQGYTPSGVLTNSLTGNVIRGAQVSIWEDVGGGNFQWAGGMIAGDGTYFFDVPPGTYKVLVQYDLAGEQWRGPFEVNSPIPYEDMALVPVTQDSDPPVVELSPEVGSEVTGLAMDPLVGLAVAEIVPDSIVNADFFIEYFEQGDDSVAFSVRSADDISPSYVKLLFIDQLGNSTEREIVLGTSTNVPPGPADVSASLSLEQNYPNPFNPTTTISYSIPSSTHVTMLIYDVGGRPVRTLVNEPRKAGKHSIVWDGRDDRGIEVSSGVYFARLQGSGEAIKKKLVLVK